MREREEARKQPPRRRIFSASRASTIRGPTDEWRFRPGLFACSPARFSCSSRPGRSPRRAWRNPNAASRGGAEREPVAAEVIDGPFEERILERLAADVDAFIEDLARPALLPRHEVRQLFEVLVHAREPPGHLRRAGLQARFSNRDVSP